MKNEESLAVPVMAQIITEDMSDQEVLSLYMAGASGKTCTNEEARDLFTEDDGTMHGTTLDALGVIVELRRNGA